MAPPLEATRTVTALEARETRFYYNNGRCGDKTIYVCRPGIVFGMLGAIVIGLAVIFYALYVFRNTAVVKPLWNSPQRIKRSLRRRRKAMRVRRAKADVEMTVVDFDDGKTVDSDAPKDSTAAGDTQTASASNTRHVHFSGP